MGGRQGGEIPASEYQHFTDADMQQYAFVRTFHTTGNCSLDGLSLLMSLPCHACHQCHSRCEPQALAP